MVERERWTMSLERLPNGTEALVTFPTKAMGGVIALRSRVLSHKFHLPGGVWMVVDLPCYQIMSPN